MRSFRRLVNWCQPEVWPDFMTRNSDGIFNLDGALWRHFALAPTGDSGLVDTQLSSEIDHFQVSRFEQGEKEVHRVHERDSCATHNYCQA